MKTPNTNRVRIKWFASEQGKELEPSDNITNLYKATEGFYQIVSVSGFNTRTDLDSTLKSISQTLKDMRHRFKTIGTNGSTTAWPELVCVQNYGYSIYGRPASRYPRFK